MAKLPLFQELGTSFMSLGDALTGHPERARKRWEDYAHESVIGSGIYAAVEAERGNLDKAEELGKGMGRATGAALLGGGLLKNVPVLHELATAGEALGDVIGGGDTDAAAKRWGDYAENSVIGTGIYAAVEARNGNKKRAEELGKNMGKAMLKGVVSIAAVGATVVTVGAAAPLGAAVAAGAGGLTGAAAGAGEAAVEMAISGGKIRAGEVLGATFMGGAGGAIQGAMTGRAARAPNAANVAEVDAVLARKTECGVGGEIEGAMADRVARPSKVAEADAVLAQMAKGEIHPSILQEWQAVEDAGAAERAIMDAADVAAVEFDLPHLQRDFKARALGSKCSFISSDSSIAYYKQGKNAGLQRSSFYYKGGRASRNSIFSDVWCPTDPKSAVDAGAAHEAARIDAQMKGNSLSKSKQPGVIAVVQDENGNAMGGHSVRGAKNKSSLQKTLTKRQGKVLEKIPPAERGQGHGNCAEQPITHNVQHIKRYHARGQDKVPKLFTGSKNVITAYRRGVVEYEISVPACQTCQVTNRFYRINDAVHDPNAVIEQCNH